VRREGLTSTGMNVGTCLVEKEMDFLKRGSLGLVAATAATQSIVEADIIILSLITIYLVKELSVSS
jgi:hypothetical protein